MANPLIHVLFVDVTTNTAFAQAEVPAEQLPQTFELQTTMHLGDADWEVVKAEPMTAQEFKQTGKLILTLQRVEYISTKDIWYTLPTIRDAIPPANGNLKANQHILEMHEDSWGQIELISDSLQNEIDAELMDIRRIYREYSELSNNHRFFSKLHVRSRIQSPIVTSITLGELGSLLPDAAKELQGVAYQQSDRLISGARAFETGEWIVYCGEVDGRLIEIGLYRNHAERNQAEALATSLARLMSEHHLVLIDWCQLFQLGPNVGDLRTYLRGENP